MFFINSFSNQTFCLRKKKVYQNIVKSNRMKKVPKFSTYVIFAQVQSLQSQHRVWMKKFNLRNEFQMI